jgi:iron complex transport system substrate-binding protein
LKNYYPARIICLTEETIETLYLLNEQDRIVGISGFAVRPAGVRKEKPIVSTFTDADVESILALRPDLVLGFSDIQAEIAKKLVEKGITVWINNHRTVAEILKMIVQLGSLVGKQQEALKLVHSYEARIKNYREKAAAYSLKPTVYFEEWFDPLISGISWVSELVEIAGGTDIYRHIQPAPLAKDRIIANPDEVIERNPDIILASWCGRMFKKERLVARAGWERIEAVKNDEIHEIKSPIILQPGPAALTEGLDAIAMIIEGWRKKNRNDAKSAKR